MNFELFDSKKASPASSAAQGAMQKSASAMKIRPRLAVPENVLGREKARMAALLGGRPSVFRAIGFMRGVSVDSTQERYLFSSRMERPKSTRNIPQKEDNHE
ncbi:MAG: hypothetical protein L0Z50_17860 [Verrucomicrobiales bacterium]|nr:hypothetical protein [Verrucomicrobiales bacterium]